MQLAEITRFSDSEVVYQGKFVLYSGKPRHSISSSVLTIATQTPPSVAGIPVIQEKYPLKKGRTVSLVSLLLRYRVPLLYILQEQKVRVGSDHVCGRRFSTCTARLTGGFGIIILTGSWHANSANSTVNGSGSGLNKVRDPHRVVQTSIGVQKNARYLLIAKPQN
jgi:hypothetical protein